jgi:hypothetical protein
MWNGTAEILKSSPTEVVASARNTSGSSGERAAMASAITPSLVDPEMPYITEKP